MRFGNWRGVTLAIALMTAFVGTSAKADWFSRAIPTSTPAMDYRTGKPYYAPPVPYGHYAKDTGAGVHKMIGGLKGHLTGMGNGLGLGMICSNCNGSGCNECGGRGLFAHGGGGCENGNCGGRHALGLGCGNSCLFGKHRFGGLGHGQGCNACGTPVASAQGPAPSAQAPLASAQGGSCGLKGCLSKLHHHHGSNAGCGLCGGNGLGIGRGLGRLCGSCGGRGCGACGGMGNIFGGNGSGCGMCGGSGCPNCMGAGLGQKAHGLLHSLTHPNSNKIKYFVGAGGPVPITPGYVPYVITTRSPRDFFAFPPFTPERD